MLFQTLPSILHAATKAKSHGKPAIKRLGLWLKEKTIVFARWAMLKIIQAGQILKILLTLAAQKLKNKGIPMLKRSAEWLKDLSSRFYRKAKKVAEEKVNNVRKDIATEKTKASEADAVPVSVSLEVILKEEESISINERLAREINQNGIKCEAVTEIGSLGIEKKPPYSFLFPLSPRIVTNRGCIRLTQENGRSNIDLIQIVQKN
jgi:uncharacterized membrane-anchored protein YjiN (DUF445 family)